MFDAYWWCRSNLVSGLDGGRGGPMKQCLVCCRYKCVLVPVHVEWCVRMSDGFRLKALEILLGPMPYGVACGSHIKIFKL